MSHSADTATLRSEIAALRAELAAVHAEASKRRRQSLLRRKKAAAEPTRSRSDDSKEVVQECPAAPPLVPDSETTEEQDATVEVGAGDGPVDSELRMTGDGAKLRRKRSVKPLRERSANRDKHESRAPRKHLVDHPGRVRERKVAKKVAQARRRWAANASRRRRRWRGNEQQGRKAAKAMAAAAKATAAEWASGSRRRSGAQARKRQKADAQAEPARGVACHCRGGALRAQAGEGQAGRGGGGARGRVCAHQAHTRLFARGTASQGLASARGCPRRTGQRRRASVDSGGRRWRSGSRARRSPRARRDSAACTSCSSAVNGRPTWRRADGGDQWLAWGGHAWFVQGESSLGGSAGYATLSEECATPDLGRGVWEVPVGGSWQPQPGLRCVRASAAELQPCALRLGSSAGGGGRREVRRPRPSTSSPAITGSSPTASTAGRCGVTRYGRSLSSALPTAHGRCAAGSCAVRRCCCASMTRPSRCPS